MILARTDKRYRGGESAKRGAELARPILKKCEYSSDEIILITQCIAEHDQPKLRSKLLEARILKDADYLDGFGARSIMRSIMYAGETGGGVAEVLTRLAKKGKKRLEGLEFVESKRLGWKLHRLTEVFLAELKHFKNLEDVSYTGKFIVIEGISGSGKDTQAKLLAEYLKKKKKKVKVVNHPTELLKRLWRQWRKEVDDRFSELFLLLADRSRMVKNVILPALQQGEVVISTRSQISAQVYQKVKDYPSAFYRFCFAFEPIADLYIYLDVSADKALQRADKRVQEGIERDRGFFGEKQEIQRTAYRKVLRNYPNAVKVDANLTTEIVAQQIRRVVERRLIA